MSVFAIADLHLSLAPDVDKPMDIYGHRWHDHVRRLEENWKRMVTDDDTVIIAGDISWALKLEDAKYDLDWVDSLPGHKVMYKGNHDLWWNGITKLNKMYDTITFVQNDCFAAEDDSVMRNAVGSYAAMERIIHTCPGVFERNGEEIIVDILSFRKTADYQWTVVPCLLTVGICPYFQRDTTSITAEVSLISDSTKKARLKSPAAAHHQDSKG